MSYVREHSKFFVDLWLRNSKPPIIIIHHYKVMEGNFKRRMRNAMKRLQEEEELSRLPKITSVAERRRVELPVYTSRSCQFPKHLENSTTYDFGEEEADHDLRFTKRGHQEEYLVMQRLLMEQKRLTETLQMKMKFLEEELKKAKELDFKKSTIISHLLLEREKFHHENKELVGIRFQLRGEKQRLSEQFEEELSKKTMIISNLLVDREKLDHENKELLRICGEKQRFCEHVEKELSRQQSLICDLLSDRDKLQFENKELVRIDLRLRGEKQQLCEYFDEKLSRERKLRNDCSRTLLCRDELISLLCREHKTCCVSIWQTSAEVTKPEDKKESLEKLKPQFLENTLKKGWLKASLENLKAKKSKESRERTLGWLQKSLKNLKEVSDKPSRHSLAEWLKGSLINLQKESPEAPKEDVSDWLEMSINQLQDEGPETSHMNVQEWLETSIQGIQDLKKSETEPRSSLRKGWLERSIENLKKLHSEGPVENLLKWLQGSLERLLSSTEARPVLEEWLQDSLKSLEEESSEVDNQDVKVWLQTSINNLEDEGPGASYLGIQEWLETSIKGIQDLNKAFVKGIQDLNKAFVKGIQDLNEASIKGTQDLNIGRRERAEESRERVIRVELTSSERSLRNRWLQDSLESSRELGSTASRTGLQGWLRASLRKLRRDSPDGARTNLEEWIQESIKNIQEGCPEEFRQPVKEWLGRSLNHFEEGGPGASHLSVEEWLEASIQGLQEERFKEMTGSTLPEKWRRKFAAQGIPSQEKQVVRKILGKESSRYRPATFPNFSIFSNSLVVVPSGSSRCRKKTGQRMKITGAILLAVFLFAIFVHFRLYCLVVSERGLRPY